MAHTYMPSYKFVIFKNVFHSIWVKAYMCIHMLLDFWNQIMLSLVCALLSPRNFLDLKNLFALTLEHTIYLLYGFHLTKYIFIVIGIYVYRLFVTFWLIP